ncbi:MULTISPECIES: amino acid ABC transporter permease [Micromonospora]|uniref:Glutamate transport system permease protein n=2 Tax=Micromonospora TaxID=1873 RepID=A0A1C6SQG7_9ACTN|nr:MULTISPECIES: amino acid ABC transporter permease [Micromonospora]TWJ30610.1 amino acid ABC transporter membrane protein 1, PAAT family (TC 3.A.1.3.-) [Micromonospora sagamiensis]BCL16358.1 amino acid ABC transporter permease [Micromonospora sagamiensis]SCL31757.1 glutamate transport system permease protein [Micromonospora inyonensis]
MGEFFRVLTDNAALFRDGFTTTVQLFLIAGVGSLVLGMVLGAMRVSPVPALRAFGATYVNLVRNTPLTLVFAFLVFAVPKLDVNIDYFESAVTALTVYTAAFVCEVVRSGVNTVAPGQAEAARALGMTFGQVLTLIVMPQALRAMVPPMMSVFIAMLKNTTIAAGFSVLEAGAIPAYMAERGEPQFAVLLWITIGFLILILPLVALQRFLERKWAVAR